MKNKDLKEKYEKMHTRGEAAWFDNGDEERDLIIRTGKPWNGKSILEIGCGEGNLAAEIVIWGAKVVRAVDYSEVAIRKAKGKWGESEYLRFLAGDYRKIKDSRINDRIVLQGVLEHLDDPFKELKWMMDNLLVEGGDVITSSPGFLNPRGIAWAALTMAGAVMSKTDLHMLNPWDFESFVEENGYTMPHMISTDNEWGFGRKMIRDLEDRIPKAFADGKLDVDEAKQAEFLSWMKAAGRYSPGSPLTGATIVYHIRS